MTHRRYTIVLERANGNYSAYAPDLPGVVAAGETAEETEQLMRKAVAVYLEELRSTGQPIPEPTATVRVIDVVA